MTYSLPTLIGNWMDRKVIQDIEENLLENRKKNCQLIKHKKEELWKHFFTPVVKPATRNHVYLGRSYQIVHKGDRTNKSFCLSVTPTPDVFFKSNGVYNDCLLSASENIEPCLRNSFVLISPNPNSDPYAKASFNENIYIAFKSSKGDMYLTYDRRITKALGEFSDITLVKRPDPYCLFQLYNPFFRDGNYIIHSKKDKVMLKHTLTGRYILLKHLIFPTVFGSELRVTCELEFTPNKLETMEKLWIFQ